MVATQKTKQNQRVDEMISLRDILDIFVYNWKWFVLSIIFCLIVGRAYLYIKPKIYRRSAVMLVKDDSSGGGSSSSRSRGGTDALMQLNGVMMGTSVQNEVYILQSHQIMKQVVRSLHLDVNYTHRHRLQTRNLYHTRPFTVRFDSVDIETLKPYSFQVELNGKQAHISKYMAPHEEDEEVPEVDIVVELGKPFQLPITQKPIVLIPHEANLEEFQGERITVSHVTVEAAANAYGASLEAGEIDRQSTLVGITYTDQYIPRAEDILNAVLSAYRRSIIDDKNRIAQSTAAFIDERIELISKELSKVEDDLADFKQRNRIVDVKADANNFLQQSNQARQRSILLESQVSVVQFLLDFVRDRSRGFNLIPTLSGLTDNGIQSQISRYNELMLERNRLIEHSSADNPRVRQADQNLEQMRETIIASTEAYLSSLNVQLRRSKQEESGLNQVISSVPAKEKQSLDISRQQAIKETL